MTRKYSPDDWLVVFWRRVEISDCWIWRGVIDRHGYGRIARSRAAHRFAYEQFVGTISPGLVIDHLCRNRACVNPAHMEPVSHAVNTARGNSATSINSAKTHCVNGHPFNTDNTYWFKKSTGRLARCCRACNRAAKAKARAQQEVAAK